MLAHPTDRWRSSLAAGRPLAAVALLALAAVALSACGDMGCSSSSGGSGYQANGIESVPQMQSCTNAMTMTAGAGANTDPANPAMVAQNTGFNNNGYFGVFYAMPGTATALPIAGGAATLTLTTGPVHPHANPNDYTLTSTAAGYIPYCEVASGGLTFANPTYPMSGTTATLRVNFPAFTGAGSFTINCVGVNGASSTTRATLQVIVP